MKHGNFPALSRLLHVSMVLLGVTMSGEKLAPLVVFKEVPDARIQPTRIQQLTVCLSLTDGLLLSGKGVGR
jgi:hypothetical protein